MFTPPVFGVVEASIEGNFGTAFKFATIYFFYSDYTSVCHSSSPSTIREHDVEEEELFLLYRNFHILFYEKSRKITRLSRITAEKRPVFSFLNQIYDSGF